MSPSGRSPDHACAPPRASSHSLPLLVVLFAPGPAPGAPRVAALRARLSDRGVRADRLVVTQLMPSWHAHVPPADQVRLARLADGDLLARVCFGQDDPPDVPLALARAGLPVLGDAGTRYVLAIDLADPGALDALPAWRRRLFRLLAAREAPASRVYRIPACALLDPV